MSLTTVLLIASAQAGTAIWLDAERAPDPSATPDDTTVLVEDIVKPQAFTQSDQAAARKLTEEIAACTPLLDEFDGELAILQRIDRVLETVEVIRPTDVDVVWQALVLQGLAAHRYFPDPSSAEASDAGVVSTVSSRAENRPWADAIALLPDRMPTTTELADEAARLAFQEQRARAWLVPSTVVIITDMPDYAVVRVDGRAQEPGTNRVALVPGRHRISIEIKGNIHQRIRIDTRSDVTHTVGFLADATDFAALANRLSTATAPLSLPPAVLTRTASLDAPVSLVVPQKRGVGIFVVDGSQAIPSEAGLRTSPSDQRGLQLSAGLGGGWVYDGDYLLQNHREGAPEETSTVNAGAPVVHLSGQVPLGSTPLKAGAGLDLMVPLGEFHSLPSGSQQLRLRAYPHLAVGAGPAALTVGWWTPWHLGVGVQGAVPIATNWSVTGAFTQGIGLARPRDDGSEFAPATARMGWLGLTRSFGD